MPRNARKQRDFAECGTISPKSSLQRLPLSSGSHLSSANFKHRRATLASADFGEIGPHCFGEMRLQRLRVMHILTGTQSCSNRIVSDVAAVVIEVLRAAHEMIEPVLLPKVTSLVNQFVDLSCFVPPPRTRSWQHCLGGLKRGQDVDMVRHHHKISQFIVLSIEMPQIVRNSPSGVPIMPGAKYAELPE